LIKWNKKVPKELIARLYKKTSTGIFDDELIDEAGWALYSRCESIVAVTFGYEEKYLPCPKCSSNIKLAHDEFKCECGGLNATWSEFRASYKGKQLYAANAVDIFTDYCKNFPVKKTYVDKLICIDVLIHSFHIHRSYDIKKGEHTPESAELKLNRPTGANLIEGTLKEVVEFLNNLSAIDSYSKKNNAR